jgi:hypothetical protein
LLVAVPSSRDQLVLMRRVQSLKLVLASPIRGGGDAGSLAARGLIVQVQDLDGGFR